MMDTILNLGLNDETVDGLAKGGERFAWVRQLIGFSLAILLIFIKFEFSDTST